MLLLLMLIALVLSGTPSLKGRGLADGVTSDRLLWAWTWPDSVCTDSLDTISLV